MAAIIAGSAIVATPASAQVIEIGETGEIVRHDGPALYLGRDARPQPLRLMAPAARASNSAATASSTVVTQAIAAAAATHGVSRDLAGAVACTNRGCVPRRFRRRARSA